MIDRTLATWPDLIDAFVDDLGTCQSHAEAQYLLDGLTHADKTLIFKACPESLQHRLWRMRGEAAA